MALDRLVAPDPKKPDETLTDSSGRVIATEESGLPGLGAGPGLKNAPSIVAQKSREAALTFAREQLNAIATSPYLTTGQPMHADDVDAFLADALKDADAAPAKLRNALRTAAADIVAKIAEGDRLGAEQYAREAVFAVADATPATFDPASSAPDPAALAAQIAR